MEQTTQQNTLLKERGKNQPLNQVLPSPLTLKSGAKTEVQKKLAYCFAFSVIENKEQRQELQKALLDISHALQNTSISGAKINVDSISHITLKALSHAIQKNGKIPSELKPSFLYVLDFAKSRGVMHASEVFMFVAKPQQLTLSQQERQKAVLANIELEKQKSSLEKSYSQQYRKHIELLLKINSINQSFNKQDYDLLDALNKGELTHTHHEYIKKLEQTHRRSPSVQTSLFSLDTIKQDITDISIKIETLFNDEITYEKIQLYYHLNDAIGFIKTLQKYITFASNPNIDQLKGIMTFISKRLSVFSQSHHSFKESNNIFSHISKEIKTLSDKQGLVEGVIDVEQVELVAGALPVFIASLQQEKHRMGQKI